MSLRSEPEDASSAGGDRDVSAEADSTFPVDAERASPGAEDAAGASAALAHLHLQTLAAAALANLSADKLGLEALVADHAQTNLLSACLGLLRLDPSPPPAAALAHLDAPASATAAGPPTSSSSLVPAPASGTTAASARDSAMSAAPHALQQLLEPAAAAEAHRRQLLQRLPARLRCYTSVLVANAMSHAVLAKAMLSCGNAVALREAVMSLPSPRFACGDLLKRGRAGATKPRSQAASLRSPVARPAQRGRAELRPLVVAGRHRGPRLRGRVPHGHAQPAGVGGRPRHPLAGPAAPHARAAWRRRASNRAAAAVQGDATAGRRGGGDVADRRRRGRWRAGRAVQQRALAPDAQHAAVRLQGGRRASGLWPTVHFVSISLLSGQASSRSSLPPQVLDLLAWVDFYDPQSDTFGEQGAHMLSL